jgi:DNA-binding MarR family transcriptional regulator
MNKDILSTDEAMVLQQIYEDGEDDIRSLSYELGITRQNAIKEALKLEQKGMITFQHSFDGLLLRVSGLGRATVRRLWPEAAAFAVA